FQVEPAAVGHRSHPMFCTMHGRTLGAAWGVVLVSLLGAIAGAHAGAFPDLEVYRHGGRSVLDHVSPYAHDDPIYGYPFTYPPFAALLFTPLALLPGWASAAL